MSDTPLISMIVPVYNVAPYLRRCLDSVVNQTYPNLEIILVASTSTDNSVSICEEYQKNYPNIILLHTEPNGLSDARNRGIDIANGEYLSFIDSDDYISPDFITTLYSICKEHNCDIAQCGFQWVSEEQNEIINDAQKDVAVYTGKEMCYNFYYGIPDGITDVVTWSKLYRRELFSTLRFPVGKIHEDEATTHQLFYCAKKVGVTEQILYFYRRVSTSIMGVGFTLKRLDRLQFFEERAEYFKKMNEPELHALWYLHYVKSYAGYLRNLKTYYPQEISLRKSLRKRCRKGQVEVLKCPRISLKDKVLMILILDFPRTTKILGMVKRMVLG